MVSIPAGPETPEYPEPFGSLVKADDVIGKMGGATLTNAQRVTLEQTIAGVQSELEMRLNRPVQPVHVRQVARPDHTGFVKTKITPVHKVISLQQYSGSTLLPSNVQVIDKIPLDDDGEMLDIDIPSQVGESVYTTPGGIQTGYYSSTGLVLVEYVGGYMGYWDEGLKQAIMRVVVRDFEPNHDDSLNLRDDNAEKANASDSRERGWTDQEIKSLERLRRRVIA